MKDNNWLRVAAVAAIPFLSIAASWQLCYGHNTGTIHAETATAYAMYEVVGYFLVPTFSVLGLIIWLVLRNKKITINTTHGFDE
jgi:hypothetical protein